MYAFPIVPSMSGDFFFHYVSYATPKITLDAGAFYYYVYKYYLYIFVIGFYRINILPAKDIFWYFFWNNIGLSVRVREEERSFEVKVL